MSSKKMTISFTSTGQDQPELRPESKQRSLAKGTMIGMPGFDQLKREHEDARQKEQDPLNQPLTKGTMIGFSLPEFELSNDAPQLSPTSKAPRQEQPEDHVMPSDGAFTDPPSLLNESTAKVEVRTDQSQNDQLKLENESSMEKGSSLEKESNRTDSSGAPDSVQNGHDSVQNSHDSVVSIFDKVLPEVPDVPIVNEPRLTQPEAQGLSVIDSSDPKIQQLANQDTYQLDRVTPNPKKPSSSIKIQDELKHATNEDLSHISSEANVEQVPQWFVDNQERLEAEKLKTERFDAGSFNTGHSDAGNFYNLPRELEYQKGRKPFFIAALILFLLILIVAALKYYQVIPSL